MSKLSLATPILLAWLGTACAPDDELPLAPPSSAAANGRGGAPRPASTSATTDTTISPEQAESRARALLDSWLIAQNDRNLEAYAKLYAADFAGIRRTPSGEEKKLGTQEWLVDRGTLFAKPQRVMADEIAITTWHDGALPAGQIELSFVQRWKSQTAADHGPKVLRLRASTDGSLQIIAEELKSSAQGWSGKKPLEVDGSALRSPVTVQALWKTRAPHSVELFVRVTDATGASHEWVVPFSLCAGSDDGGPRGSLPPKASGPILLESRVTCGPEYEDFFRVVADAEGLVVRNRTLIDLHQDGPGSSSDTGWQDTLRVKLAPGTVARGK